MNSAHEHSNDNLLDGPIIHEEQVDTIYGRMTIRHHQVDGGLNGGTIRQYRLLVDLPTLAPEFHYIGMQDILRQTLEWAHDIAYLHAPEGNDSHTFFRWQFTNRLLNNGMRSSNYIQFGDSSVEQCLMDFRASYTNNREKYANDTPNFASNVTIDNGGIFGTRYNSTRLTIGVLHVHNSVAQGRAWDDNDCLIMRDFTVSSLTSETNCLYQALVWSRDNLHDGAKASRKDCLGLSSKDCRSDGTDVSTRAKELKKELSVKQESLSFSFAHVEATCQAFANSRGGRCDIHLYDSGVYKKTILREFNRKLSKNHESHQPDLYITINGNHAEGMIPYQYITKKGDRSNFPRIMRATTSSYKYKGETKTKQVIDEEWGDRHKRRLLWSVDCSEHPVYQHIAPNKSEDNHRFIQNLLLPLMEEKSGQALARGDTATAKKCNESVERLQKNQRRQLADYMDKKRHAYANLFVSGERGLHPPLKWKLKDQEKRLWHAATRQLLENKHLVLGESLDALSISLETMPAFDDGLAETLTSFMQIDGFDSLSALQKAIDEGELQKKTEVLEAKLIDKIKLCGNKEEIVGHESGVPSRNKKLGAYDFECAIDPKKEDQAYAAGIAWMVDPDDMSKWREATKEFTKSVGCSGIEIYDETLADEDGSDYSQQYMCIRFYGNPNNPHPELREKNATDLLFQEFLGHEQVWGQFQGYYLYAHNGGKYDASMVLQSLTKRDAKVELAASFRSASLQSIEQNGRFIDLGIARRQEVAAKKSAKEHKESCVHLRDSMCFFAGGLEGLAKEYDVPHKKLVEEFDVLSVTLGDFHDDPSRFVLLDKYLKHDCLGLVEAMNRMSIGMFASSVCDVKQPRVSTECKVRRIMEALTGVEWGKAKSKLKFLQSCRGTPLELDLYNEDLKCGMEVNGVSHRTSDCRFWYNNPSRKGKPYTFKDRQEDDKDKLRLCKENGVKLGILEHDDIVEPKSLLRKCKELIRELEIPSEPMNADEEIIKFCNKPNSIRLGVDLTTCLTGATFSKKKYWLKYYSPKNTPIYMLSPEMDEFVRKSYCGGRVECFYLGNSVACLKRGEHLYYFDVTSLFPAMGLKDIPHGKPSMVTDLDKIYDTPEAFENALRRKDLFGTIHCRVRSTELGKTRKPLHGRKRDDMLVFEHYGEWQEEWLFSEEVLKGIELGLYEYEPIDAITFERTTSPVAQYFREGFLEKALQKALGNKGRELAAKVCINSLYGAFGLVVIGKDGIEFHRLDNCDVYKYLQTKTLQDVKIVGNIVILRVTKDLPVQDFNVQISAAITSYARLHMYDIMDYIEQKGGVIVYTDTDSIQTDFNIFEDEVFMKRFCSDEKGEIDWTGAALGGIKCEVGDDLGKALKRKFNGETPEGENKKKEVASKVQEVLKQIRDHDGNASPGGIGVNVATNVGNKEYELYRDFSDIVGFELTVWKTAHKGFKADTDKRTSLEVSPELCELLYEAFHRLKPEEFEAAVKPLCDYTLERKQGNRGTLISRLQTGLLNGMVRAQIQTRAKFTKRDMVGGKGFGITWTDSMRTMSMMPPSDKRDQGGEKKEDPKLLEHTEFVGKIGKSIRDWNNKGFDEFTSKLRKPLDELVPKYRKGVVNKIDNVSDCFKVEPFVA